MKGPIIRQIVDTLYYLNVNIEVKKKRNKQTNQKTRWMFSCIAQF